jgi:hypothetical protein
MFLGANAYAFLGLTALVGGLTGLVVFALARFMTASRQTRRRASSGASRRCCRALSRRPLSA